MLAVEVEMARSYRLGKRAAKMAETRQRIVEAAYELLCRDGAGELSLDEVAAKAGVGRTTIFLQFESRSGLLRALEQHVSDRAGVASLRTELTQKDARKALRAAFTIGSGVWAAERVAFRQLFGLAAIDAELRQVMVEKDAMRRQLIDFIVEGLRSQGHLAGAPARAHDLLLVLTSFDTFEAVYGERKIADSVAKLLVEAAESLILRG